MFFKQIDPDLHIHSIRQQCRSYSEDEFNEKFKRFSTYIFNTC